MRISAGAKALGVRVEPLASGAPQYRVKDVFTTYNGSWVVGEQPAPYGIEQWAKDTYDVASFDDSGAAHHLFAMVLDRHGNHIGNHIIYYATPGYAGNDTTEITKPHSGWANNALWPSSSFSPARGERGIWQWGPSDAEIVTGGGLPNRHHVSTFAVWQEADGAVVPPPDGDIGERLARLEQWARGLSYAG